MSGILQIIKGNKVKEVKDPNILYWGKAGKPEFSSKILSRSVLEQADRVIYFFKWRPGYIVLKDRGTFQHSVGKLEFENA